MTGGVAKGRLALISAERDQVTRTACVFVWPVALQPATFWLGGERPLVDAVANRGSKPFPHSRSG
jgi:hypothetical protein